MTTRQGYAHDRAMLRRIEEDAHCNDYCEEPEEEEERFIAEIKMDEVQSVKEISAKGVVYEQD